MSHTLVDDAAWASPWRHLRVSEKLSLSGGMILSALILPPLGDALIAVAAVALMLGPSRVPLRTVLILATAPAVFLLLGTIPIAFEGWPPVLTSAGLVRAGQLWTGSFAGTLALLLFATTTPLHALISWLQRLRMPVELVDIAALVYRMLLTLLHTTMQLFSARDARLGSAAPLRRRLESVADIVTTLFVQTWQRSARMQIGLEGRGFDGTLKTLTARPARSWLFVGTSIALIGTVWVVTWVVP